MNNINALPAIQLNHLHYRYNSGNFMLNDINLAFLEHEFTAIIGQNGCGKTTLLKNISGLVRPSRGNILLRGIDTETMDIAEIAGEIGFVMQESDRQLFESTVYNEVAFALKHTPQGPPQGPLRGRKLTNSQIQEKTEEVLSMTGLLDRRDVFPPSLGRADRIKTVFAAILAMGPKIIMLDEPLAGQDRRGCQLIMNILVNLHRQDYTILMVTHNVNAVAEYAQRLIVMKEGSVFMDGNPREIFARTEELAQAGILSPQITRLSRSLRKRIPLENDALSPAELASMLVGLKNKK